MARDTQFSFPQAGLQPADGIDCGAYTANEYKAMYIAYMRSGGMIRTGAALPGLPATPLYPNVGVFYVCPDRLAVTSSGAAVISIATGAYICDGAFGYNDTAIVDTAVTLPAANPRIDRVVIRQNYTAADYTSVNVPALVVPANTARLCVISGAEAGAPVPLALTQDQDRLTYWDIPLFQYQIANATGVISGLTDEREWVDAETKRVFVSSTTGRNITDGTDILDTLNLGDGPILPDNKIADAYVRIPIGHDFISGAEITVMLEPIGTGNVYVQINGTHLICGQVASFGFSDGFTAVAVSNGIMECIMTTSLPSTAANHVIQAYLRRDATNILDTVNADVHFKGFYIEYLGWGRK